MPARLPPNRTVNSRAVLAKMERWSRAALARLAKQAEHTDRSGATQTVFHSTASSLPIPFVICRLLLTASSGAKYDEKSGLRAFCRRHGIGYAPPTPSGQYDFPPGEEVQHDTSPHELELGGKKRKVQTASAVLCYSRMLFFQCYPHFRRFDCK